MRLNWSGFAEALRAESRIFATLSIKKVLNAFAIFCSFTVVSSHLPHIFTLSTENWGGKNVFYFQYILGSDPVEFFGKIRLFIRLNLQFDFCNFLKLSFDEIILWEFFESSQSLDLLAKSLTLVHQKLSWCVFLPAPQNDSMSVKGPPSWSVKMVLSWSLVKFLSIE